MKKTKILVSICVATALGLGAITSIYKINENNKKDIVEVKNENINKEQEETTGETTGEKNEVIKEEEKIIVESSDNKNVVMNDTEDIEKVESNEIKDEMKGTQSNEVKEENSIVNKDSEDKVIYDDSFLDFIDKVQVDKGEVNEDVKVPEQDIKPNYNQSDSYISEIEEAIFTRVNLERKVNGLQPLNYNNTMHNYARIKSKDMGDRGYFAHENPEGELITAQMKRDGITYSAWGENIAYIQGNYSNASLATQFMDNWMNSQGHRENILSSNFKSIGIGVYKIGNTYYATQEFYR